MSDLRSASTILQWMAAEASDETVQGGPLDGLSRRKALTCLSDLVAAAGSTIEFLDLELRLLRAWRASGLSLGKFVVLALTWHEWGSLQAADVAETSDEALLCVLERYLQERAR